ncbi:hypothetical protein SAMN05444369_11525 [Capnocytophaga haemolytica]|uniref:Transcriptional regulator n=1 Tax=Capnocytophaga haemolytica TaxID=45243 RepID=A0AAX2GXZ1_9FLAO|nr:hypothetical protein [Capnocytophaga haemolytica]AMD85011.1 hypothetical protein AXF12_05465 [Capnocytophaga haemolytica]SFO24668.1 hypothetical protein SAMN05444369_11525 [Capnocytophaga haemolytica]SNV05773.1 Uncharacterised protein [Capnocytophaga haemolytica]
MNKEENLQLRWETLVGKLSAIFAEGERINLDGILYLIGVQELGQGVRRYYKDEKVNLMHIAVCRLLEPYGYYQYAHTDEEGWPHYTIATPLPALSPEQQTLLMQEAIVRYFTENDFL